MLILAAFLVFIYFGSLVGFNFWLERQDNKLLVYRLPAGTAAFLLGAFIVELAFCCVAFSQPSLVAYTWIVGICFAVLYCAARFDTFKTKLMWMPLVCAAGTYALQKTTGMTISLPYGVFAGAIWLGVMALVMFFDKLPLLNFLTVGTWALAFTAMTVLTGLGAPQIAVLGLFVLVPLWGLLNILSQHSEGRLGPYASAFLGFVMGGMIALCVFHQAYGSVFALMSYYLFELFFFVLALCGLHPLGMQRGDFAFTTVLSNNNPTPLVKVVFFRLLILSLIAALMWQTNKMGILSVVIFVILVDTYNRFKAAGAPPPTIRQLWRETKEGLKQTWQNRGQILARSKMVFDKKVKAEKMLLTSKRKVSKKKVKRKKKK